MNGFDFHWGMVDFGYDRAMKNAKAQMREFVKYANMAGSKKLTKELRDEWIRKYKAAEEMRNRMF